MKSQLALVLAILAELAVSNAWADGKGDGKKAKKDKAIESTIAKVVEEYLDSGNDGVVDVIKDKKGNVQKLVVLGTARISTVLGAADGLQTARTEARLRAAGKFRQWLKENVSIYEEAGGERIVLLEGKEGDDEESFKESGKKIQKNTDKYKTVSTGIVRGLVVLGYKIASVNKKEKMLLLVMAWDAKTAKATKKVDKDLDEDNPEGGGNADTSKEKAKDTAERKKLEKKKGISPGAKKFFEKDK